MYFLMQSSRLALDKTALDLRKTPAVFFILAAWRNDNNVWMKNHSEEWHAGNPKQPSLGEFS